MDKHISEQEINKGKFFKWTKYGLIAFVLVGLFFYGRKWIKPTVEYDKIMTAKVQQGDIDNTISADGKIVPAFEREINAPTDTEIKNVLKLNGESVNAGDIIIELDEEYTKLEYEKLADELELKNNNIKKLKLEYDKNLRDLEYKDKIKGLEINQMETQVSNQKRLKEVGGGTDEEVEASKLKLQVGKLEKLLLENELDYKRNVNFTEKKNLELEFTIQRKRLQQLEKKLKETTVKAPASGVITWISKDIGRRVTEGQTLVKIANLDKYEVEAFTSDRNSNRLFVGMPAKVRVGKDYIDGKISNVLPAVENNTIKFLVSIDGKNSEILRPNLRAEIYLVTDQKANVLKVQNGPAFNGAPTQDIFVVREGKAIKTNIVKGLNSSDYIEIISGLNAGDEIIISETKDFDHLNDFEIKKI
ncbi:MAG: HlyD family efflux transporter periplasmic adaptor subunit [Saprospiraceae bacterium]